MSSVTGAWLIIGASQRQVHNSQGKGCGERSFRGGYSGFKNMINRQRQAEQTDAKTPIRLNWPDGAIISLMRRSLLQVVLRFTQFRRLRVAPPPLLRELSIGLGRALPISALSGSARRAQQ